MTPDTAACPPGYFRIAFLAMIAMLVAACSGSPRIPATARQRIDATDCAQTTCVDFIYIHGASHHSPEAHERFRRQIDAVHRWMQASFADTPEFAHAMLDDGRRAINPVPGLNIWGEELLLTEDLQLLNTILEAESDEVLSFLTGARARLAIDIHDLVWVSHSHHQPLLLDPLHEQIKASERAGRPVVLFGHSAGSVIAANYAFYRLPYINLKELSSRHQVTDALKKLTRDEDQNTCLSALMAADLVEFGPDGKLAATLEKTDAIAALGLEQIRGDFWDFQLGALPEFTAEKCIGEQELAGLVTFGTMNSVLMSKADDGEGMLLALLLKYLYEHGMFWLTVNHADDPVSFSLYHEEGIPKTLEKMLGEEVRLNGGFFVSARPEHGGATFLKAHSWYLNKPRDFARLTAETYADGYRRFVETANQTTESDQP